jgi:hypothetical protein
LQASSETIESQIRNSVAPLIISLAYKLHKNFSELFHEEIVSLNIQFRTSNQKIHGLNNIDSEEILHAFFEASEKGFSYNFDVYQLRIDFYYRGFKKSKNPFNAFFDIPIFFDEYNYRINFQKKNGLPVLNKFYHESLTEEEINIVTANSTKFFFEEIKKQMDFNNRKG